ATPGQAEVSQEVDPRADGGTEGIVREARDGHVNGQRRGKGLFVNRWRLGAALILAAVVALPLAVPFLECLANPSAWQVWSEYDRLLTLAGSTVQLIGGTLIVVLPLGL